MVNQKSPESPHSPVPTSRLSRLMRLGSMATGVAGNMLVAGARQLAQGKRPNMSGLVLAVPGPSGIAAIGCFVVAAGASVLRTRAAIRLRYTSEYRSYSFGFRVAVTLLSP